MSLPSPPYRPIALTSLARRVPFHQALALVASRAVYLEKGFAYVPFDRLVSILVAEVMHTLSLRWLSLRISLPSVPLALISFSGGRGEVLRRYQLGHADWPSSEGVHSFPAPPPTHTHLIDRPDMYLLFQHMNKQFIGNDFSSSSKSIDKLTPDKVDAAAELDMPLCMKVDYR